MLRLHKFLSVLLWPCLACRCLQVTQSLGVPRAYARMLCELEDFLNKTLAG